VISIFTRLANRQGSNVMALSSLTSSPRIQRIAFASTHPLTPHSLPLRPNLLSRSSHNVVAMFSLSRSVAPRALRGTPTTSPFSMSELTYSNSHLRSTQIPHSRCPSSMHINDTCQIRHLPRAHVHPRLNPSPRHRRHPPRSAPPFSRT
jgi:hypothetical protein